MPAQRVISHSLVYSRQIAQIVRQHYYPSLCAFANEYSLDFGVADLAFGHFSREWSAEAIKVLQTMSPTNLRLARVTFWQ
jgi:hypothetical protein